MRSEFDFIETLRDNFNFSTIGDDCAVLPKSSTHDLLITADMLVEDIDFSLEWSHAKYIGHKALAVSISDIAAMGGKPLHSLVSIGVPEPLWSSRFVDDFYDGYLSLARKFRVELVGGDISKTPEKVVVDSIVLGEVEKGQAILRSTAAPGDLIFVFGELGGAHAGLKLLEGGIRQDNVSIPSWQSKLIFEQLTPFPGREGAEFIDFASSMIDISDGLSSDLAHICAESQVGAIIHADKIPIHRKLRFLSEKNLKQFFKNSDVLDFALHGGEDFRLLFTISALNLQKIPKSFLALSNEVGEITDNIGNIELIRDGKSEVLSPKGFTHF